MLQKFCLELQDDLILMDCLMPVMDGLECTREIFDRWPDFSCKIVAMSAHASTDFMGALPPPGMVDRLDKPFRLAELEALLSRL